MEYPCNNINNKQTFAVYAEYVMKPKDRSGLKYRSRDLFSVFKARVLPAIGHMKLGEIRPQHLNQLYEQLCAAGQRRNTEKAQCKVDLAKILKEKGYTKNSLSVKMGGYYHSITRAVNKQIIMAESAHNIAKGLEMTPNSLFTFQRDDRPLSGRTVLEYHRFISMILSQAEKEMLIPYNPAAKATPPKYVRVEPNYFQAEDVGVILDALENVPFRWRMMTHLFIVTGCRRGEILGLKWDKVDWKNNQIYICKALYYSPGMGIYEDTPKTKGSIRYIKLPQETMDLLAEYRQWYFEEAQKFGSKWKNSNYVICGEDGGYTFPGSASTWMAAFSKENSLPHMNPHAFRHTQASLLFFNGVDPVSISKRLGHSQVSTTTDIYSHVMKQAEEQISECIADVMLSSRPKKRKANGERDTGNQISTKVDISVAKKKGEKIG